MYKSATPLKFRSVLLLGSILFFLSNDLFAQPGRPLFSKDAKTENRTRLYKSLINNAITKNLSYPLTDSSEENWMDAFYAMELIRYRPPWAEGRIHEGFAGIEKRSIDFQRALLEMLYSNYPTAFFKEVKQLIDVAGNDKVFAMCAEYLQSTTDKLLKKDIATRAFMKLAADTGNAIYKQLNFRLNNIPAVTTLPPLKDLLHQQFFPGAKVVVSFQRKNRDFPGLAIIRDSAGNFLQDSTGNFFSVVQLARSINNLPGYLSNGNTPQGIFRMFGLDTSRSNFIGLTPNIQLTMPAETSLQHFMNDSTITDSIWTENWYRKLLPASWATYFPFYETFYAGKAGRTEIIAHGTTVDPEYYKGQPYYPLTPTMGCLCTKETWSGQDGRRSESDQQKLVDALQQAGGANGYYIVIELDDEQRPVTINDILPLLQ